MKSRSLREGVLIPVEAPESTPHSLTSTEETSRIGAAFVTLQSCCGPASSRQYSTSRAGPLNHKLLRHSLSSLLSGSDVRPSVLSVARLSAGSGNLVRSSRSDVGRFAARSPNVACILNAATNNRWQPHALDARCVSHVSRNTVRRGLRHHRCV